MKRKLFIPLAVLAILCSALGTVIGPAEPARAAPTDNPNYGWVNRAFIYYEGAIWHDQDTYDRIYEYVRVTPSNLTPTNGVVNNCQPDVIKFVYDHPDPIRDDPAVEIIREGGNPTGSPSNLPNVNFFYSEKTDRDYSHVKQYRIHYSPQNVGGIDNVPCRATATELPQKLANQTNRRIVLVKSDDDTIIHLFRRDIRFKKIPTPYHVDGRDWNTYQLESDSNETCRDRIIEFPARARHTGDDRIIDLLPPRPDSHGDPMVNEPWGGGNAVLGSYTLYIVHDAQTYGKEDNISESYVSDVLGGGLQLPDCFIAFDGDLYPEVTERFYGLTSAVDEANSQGDGWGSGRLVANGLKRTGGWHEGGKSNDDAFIVFVGTLEANYIELPSEIEVPDQPIGQDAEVDDTICGQANIGGLGWLFCAIVEALETGLTWFDNAIHDFVKIDTDTIFVDQGQNFRRAWTVFRNLAYALLIILGLIMVISQIMGLDFFDAYTIRKMLPKLVIVTIIIPLLWPIMRILLEMSNEAAVAVKGILMAPFHTTAPGQITTPDQMSLSALIFGGGALGLTGLFIGGGFLAIGGWGVALALVASAALSLATTYLTLVIRDVVLYGFVIASSVIVVGKIFKPTEQAADKAIRAVGATIIVQILIEFYLSLAKIAAWIAYNAGVAKAGSNNALNDVEYVWGVILAIVFLVVGYVMAWKYLQQAFQWSKAVNGLTERAQKALSNYRSEARKKRLNEAVEGRRRFGGGPLGWAGNRMAGLVRRGRLAGDVGAGAFGLGGRAGKAKYQEAVRTMQAGVAAKMMEQDKDRAGGDDDAMRLLARRGMTGKRFVREYADMLQRRDPSMGRKIAEQRARRALALSETSLGAKAGTNAMRIAAQRSLLKSNTSYRRQLVQQPDGSWKDEEMDFAQMTKTIYGDVAELVQDGLITVADGAAMIKANGARVDRAGVGFGTAMTQLDRVSREGVAALDSLTDNGVSQVQAMADEVLIGSGPGQLVGQRHEAVRILAPEMLRRTREALSRDTMFVTDEHGLQALGREFIQSAAMAARYIDIGSQLPELNAALQANGFIGARIDDSSPDSPTIGQVVEFFRNPDEKNPLFQQIVRQHQQILTARASSADRAAPDFQARVEATALAQARAQVVDAQRVFQEYRREYSTGWQAAAGRADPTGPPGGDVTAGVAK